MTSVILHGAGRMAAAVFEAAKKEPNIEICALVAPQPPQWQQTQPYFQTLEQVDRKADVLIDFTLPDGTLTAANWCHNSGVGMLCGVTNLHQEAQDAIALAAQNVPVLWSPNLSIGVNLLRRLCAQAAAVLGQEANITIKDIHHRWKKDAPSGTALILGETMLENRPGTAGAIEYESVREGETIGRHEVVFQRSGERIILTHEAQDRSIFAQGAIAAAIWLGQQGAGRYTSDDWLSRISVSED